uniref:Vegetative cell wall protein gp1-like n=1 Tax=Echinococcus granulosus TaxID=6210 RepID=A0A068WHA1_ECHGR|nr:hypothetical protein EgrG_000441700 [Echinococcus granulosus]
MPLDPPPLLTPLPPTPQGPSTTTRSTAPPLNRQGPQTAGTHPSNRTPNREPPRTLPRTTHKEECTQQGITILMPTFRNLSCERSPGDSLGLKVTE